MAIKKGDTVLVITGNDKGRTGAVLLRKGDRVVIQGMNIRKRHVKRQAPGKSQAKMAGPVEREMSIHISNVKLVDQTKQ